MPDLCAFNRTTDTGNVIPGKVRALGCMVNAANISAKSVDFLQRLFILCDLCLRGWLIHTCTA